MAVRYQSCLLSCSVFCSHRLPAALNKVLLYLFCSQAAMDTFGNNCVATPPVAIVPFLIVPGGTAKNTGRERLFSFHYLLINVPTDDSQRPLWSYLQPNSETQSTLADTVTYGGPIYGDKTERKFSFKLTSCIADRASALPHLTSPLSPSFGQR